VAYAAVPTSPLSSSAPETKLEPSEPLPVKSSNSEARQWCFISDTIVRLATLEEALKSKAYLCFYERIDPSLHVPRL
jgi:ubiquitin carboxyl-terminal hydrolase 16/45